MVEEPIGNGNGNGRIETTTEHETIRTWVEERGSTAARVTEPTGDDTGSLAVVPDDTDDDSIERIPWEEFFRVFEEENLAFVYQTERDDPNERWFCRFVDREHEVSEEAIGTDRSGGWNVGERGGDGDHTDEGQSGRADVAWIEGSTDESVVEEGAVSETEVTRTEIVEKEVVVTHRVRSRVVGSEVVERNRVDNSVIDREIDRCEIVDEEFIETEVIEIRRVTDELFEVHTVESEVVDSERVERERVPGDADARDEETESAPEITITGDGSERGVIVESGAVRRDLERADLTEGAIIETEVIERRLVEREVADRVLIRSEIGDVEHVDSRTIGSEVLESEIVDREASERAASTTDETAGTWIEDVSTSEPEPGESEAVDAEVSEGEPTGSSVEVTEAEAGKTVVNTYGEEIGVVSAVREGTLYVDPDPGLAEKVASRFGWDSGDEESFPVEAERIERIGDGEVEIARL